MSQEPQEQQFGLLYAINVLLKKKTYIIANVVIVTGIAIAVAFMLPKKYVSNATIMPPSSVDPFSALATGGSSLLSKFGSFGGFGLMSEDMYKYIAILQSRALLENVVDEFDLQSLYEAEYKSDAIDVLAEKLDYSANEEGTLTITMEDRNPERAKNILAYVISELDSVNIELASREAKSNRKYIETRINKNLAAMDSVGKALKDFQEKHGVVPVTSEVSQSADAMAQLYNQRMLKEFEVSYLKEFLGESNPQLESAMMQLSTIDRKMEELPQLGMESFQLLRDFLVQQKIYEFMAPLFEHAKIMEHKNTPTLVILDSPMIPDRAAFPKKRLIVAVFFLFALFGSIVIVLALDRMKQMSTENSDRSTMLMQIRKNLSFRSHKS